MSYAHDVTIEPKKSAQTKIKKPLPPRFPTSPEYLDESRNSNVQIWYEEYWCLSSVKIKDLITAHAKKLKLPITSYDLSSVEITYTGCPA